eukprot:g29484.t1
MLHALRFHGWCSLVKTAELRGLELVPARVFWPAVFCKAKRKDAGLLLLVSLLQSLRAWAAQDPEALLVALDPQALRSLASALTRVEAEAEASGERAASQAWRSLWELTGEAAHRGRRCAALEATELRQDAELWRQRGEEARLRLDALRRLHGEPSQERLAELHAELGRLPDGRVVAETARPSVAVVASPELPEEESRAESGADAEETWLAFVVGAWCRGKRNFMPGPVNYQEQS